MKLIKQFFVKFMHIQVWEKLLSSLLIWHYNAEASHQVILNQYVSILVHKLERQMDILFPWHNIQYWLYLVSVLHCLNKQSTS